MHVLKCVANTGVLYFCSASKTGRSGVAHVRPRRPCGRAAPYARHSLKNKRRLRIVYSPFRPA
jgi:hypothetical protein